MTTILDAVIFGQELSLITDHRLFSPRQIDRGTQAMLSQVTTSPTDRVLDLGCGYGAVGLGAAKTLGADRVVLLDIDPLAVDVSRENAARNGLADVTVLQGDGPAACDSTFTLILSNPPYHSDFAVARRFVEGSYRKLEEGGRLYLVVKRLAWYRNKMRKVFGGVTVSKIDDYFVLMSQKRSRQNASTARPAASTTRKHARKLRRSAQKKHRP